MEWQIELSYHDIVFLSAIDWAEEVFGNGDSLIPKARALEPVFKAHMFAPVEA